MSFTAIVPVRAGSKGLPGKNTRPLAGVPLWRRAVDQAKAAGAGRVVVSTDIPELLELDSDGAVTFLSRPEALAGDTTPMAPVIAHAIESLSLEGTIVLLQCTSPLRTADDVSTGVRTFGEGGADLIMSVTEADRSVLKYGQVRDGRFHALVDPSHPFMNRQSLPAVYKPNGAVYVFDAGWFLQNDGFESDRIGTIIMPLSRSDDIDTEEDFLSIEALLARQ